MPSIALAALAGLILSACAGSFGQPGVSLPFSGDGVQTVSDAVDTLVARGNAASEDAKAAISATDAFGSIVRDVASNERFIRAVRSGVGGARSSSRPISEGVRSLSQFAIGPSAGYVSAYCQSSAGYTIDGIPSLDASFGWQSAVFTGTRTTGRRFATWSATVDGRAFEAPIGKLSVVRTAGASCAMHAPAFSIAGATAGNAFSIPLTLTYLRNEPWDLTVNDAAFSDGERLAVSTSAGRRPTVSGMLTKGGTMLASFTTDVNGNGKLTITSTGAQYVISNWIVART